MAKLKFNPANYQDLGAYALLKNIVENGHLIAEDSNSSLFPNGVKIIEDTTYTLSSSDAGYCLVATNANTHFIMPSIIPFKEGDIIGITADLDVTTFDLNSIATDIELFTGELSENGETIILQCVDVEGLNMLPLSAIIDDNGTLKTLNKYLYDKVSATPKIYEAVISQTGTDAPSLNFLFKDDLGDITFTRQDEGMYKIESAGGKFSSGEKSSLQWSFYNINYRSYITTSFEKDDDYAYLIRTYDSSGVLTDGQMTPITIKITVYP